MTDRWNRLENLASWLAEDDGIPAAVQGCFDLTPYRQQAREIIERD